MTAEEDDREVRADARDVRADARDVRSDVIDVDLKDRDIRTSVREDIVSEREGSVTGSLRFLKWLVAVLIIISIGNFARSFIIQEHVDRTVDAAKTATDASNRAELISIQGRDASLETLRELRAILARIEANNSSEPDLQRQAIIEALQAIARIEAAVCGGRCPETG